MSLHYVLRNVLGIVFYTWYLLSTFMFYTFFCNCLLHTVLYTFFNCLLYIAFYESYVILLYVSTRRAQPQRTARKILVFVYNKPLRVYQILVTYSNNLKNRIPWLLRHHPIFQKLTNPQMAFYASSTYKVTKAPHNFAK
ncbi:hypothetical protein HanXRQr2_Chr11g0508081 [Helianthus annuus]|uniref:Uncharacterized protein n=1 Tax=Helianthus annuus TaxID=4232 RepID=A0A9K3HRZ6_HELAN|nr:hypothetical protein HanXRQr2_Chr11g0508081 [Helianthus annuus]